MAPLGVARTRPGRRQPCAPGMTGHAIVILGWEDLLMLRGRLLTESLEIGADICVPALRVVRIGRQDVSGTTSSTQPDVWTFLDFEAPDEVAGELAEALAAALISGAGWYADFQTDDEHVVIFPGRILRYTKGDRAGRDATVEFGRSVGVPEHQLDWGN